MRIGVDATGWSNRRGFGRFGRNVVRAMVEQSGGDDEYVLLLDAADAEPDGLPAGARLRRVRTGSRAVEAAAAQSNRPASDLLRLGVAASRASLDVLLFPSVYTYFPAAVPTVVGVHDAIAHDLPHLTLPTLRSRVLWQAKERVAIRRAARVFTVSETSRAVLTARYGLRTERVVVTGEAPDEVFGPRAPDVCAEQLHGAGVDAAKPFLLYAGGISPHKDIVTLVEAYALVRDRLAEPPALVIAGDLERDPYMSSAAEVKGRIAELGLGPHVVLPGFVSDEQLACLYSSALAIAIPSLAEGFGLPAVEAAACGAPTTLSDIPAHRETMGDCALFFPPGDHAALAEQLVSLAEDPRSARALAARGRERVNTMSWGAAAGRLRAVVAEAARE